MSDITNAMKQICEEKNLSYEAVIETIESALAAAYRKDFGEKNQNIKVEFDPETGKSKVFDVKTVVEDMPEEEEIKIEQNEIEEVKIKDKKENKDRKVEVEPAIEIMADREALEEEVRKFNPKTELQIKDAELIKKTAKIGDVIKTKLEIPADYGRMAAQTAKQVIIQKLREAEREMIFSEFKNKEHEVVAGVVQRREGRIVLVDLDKAVGVLPAEEQIMNEKYRPGDRVKVYVKQVSITPRGPEILLSRTSDEILKKVFYLEIPEVSNGLVEIKAVAREAGSRSKVAVFSASENVDPIGSCVGQRGSRIQTIISELGGEKIDIIEYDEDLVKFIGHALSPAKILSVEVNSEEKKAVVKVAEDQLSLAIGREGQNVRLAARLTGCKLDIVGEKAKVEDVKIEETPVEAAAETETEKPEGEKKAEEKVQKKVKKTKKLKE
ncbi:MAG: transcription termination factor NusA [bacterium]